MKKVSWIKDSPLVDFSGFSSASWNMFVFSHSLLKHDGFFPSFASDQCKMFTKSSPKILNLGDFGVWFLSSQKNPGFTPATIGSKFCLLSVKSPISPKNLHIVQ